ncbi:hypothetical protein, conserved [Plasmodium gonderi]|uniref:Uncharacterized protein n=1 Tax=Plasmodium gonderi TaxID=77519 RepID=A0A1Y1JPA1_PLAGO|nr:hypothetical protein, conserved [Plasmodium gonderi]GAW82233.1 hypothetical protein, conserved [Plasmodium gonderi]
MNIVNKKLANIPCFLKRWLHSNNKFTTRHVSNRRNIEPYLSEMKKKGYSVNVLSLVISNNNLCYCLLKNKIIKKIGLINIKKDFHSNEKQGPPATTRKGKNNFEKDVLKYSYDREANPLNFNIREILTILNFIKLYSNSEKQGVSEKTSRKKNTSEDFSTQGEENDEHDMKHNEQAKQEDNHLNNKDHVKEPVQHLWNIPSNETEAGKDEWIIGIEKVNDKYEKNKMKEKILSVIVYFLSSIFECKILFFCPKEARKYFSTKCNYSLNSREETYKYIKDKVKNFPSVNKNDNNINCLFSDSYVVAFYTYRHYMHELVKNNPTVFTYLETEVRRNKSFNNILQALKKMENEQCTLDFKDLLKDRIARIVEKESYKLVDKYLL